MSFVQINIEMKVKLVKFGASDQCFKACDRNGCVCTNIGLCYLRHSVFTLSVGTGAYKAIPTHNMHKHQIFTIVEPFAHVS